MCTLLRDFATMILTNAYGPQRIGVWHNFTVITTFIYRFKEHRALTVAKWQSGNVSNEPLQTSCIGGMRGPGV